MQTDSWKQEEILTDFSEIENLKALICRLEEKYAQEGQLVCEIRVNGMLLEEEDEQRFSETPLKEIHELAVSVASLDELIQDVHKAFLECIPSLQDTADRAAEFFRQGDLKKAQNVFAALLEGCQWLVDTLVQTRRASHRYASEFFTDRSWSTAEKDFSGHIRQLLVAFERRDYALLADILEYEMTSSLDSWLNLLKKGGDLSQTDLRGHIEMGRNREPRPVEV